MEPRDIEIFLTLAEEPHFGRTAARLHVSPARIGQAIQKQERQVGALLFERHSRTVRPSPVGQQLRDDQRPCRDAFRDRHPRWKPRLQNSRFSDAFATLRRGDIDVLIAWLPIDEPDLTVGPVLFAEPRVLAVSAGHELTRRTSVSLEIAADFQHPRSDTRPG
ncbi:LysR family transcriptional regulator [Nonomuraea sp. NPDC050227]|uniref:LysR family transcriptional regulator n=1 Tax=Nonomuraea sp. NPDC050227 TaxID=3364360 RepID=UPI003789D610